MSKYNSTEIFNDWFNREKDEALEERKKRRRKERESLKEVEGVSEYGYDLNVRKYIDSRLAKIASLNSEVENRLEDYKNPQKKTKALKKNKELYTEIGILEREIKSKDPYFYTFIKQAD